MTLEFKSLNAEPTAITDRTVTGIFAVHGNVDDGGDRSHLGAFANALAGRDRVKHLWNHGGGWLDRGQSPPIAVIKSIREVSREGLPASVLSFAPDATGGAEVEREYLDTPRANEVLAGIKAGAITEMSYAYDVTNATFTETDSRMIREIHAMTLFDTSDVNWGMNPATIGKKTALVAASFADHFSIVLATLEEFTERVADLKRLRETDGRSLSTTNVDRVKTLLAELAPLEAQVSALLASPIKQIDPDLMKARLTVQRTLAQLNGVVFS